MAHGANKTDNTTSKPRALISGGARRVGAYLAEKLALNGYDLVLHYHHSHAEAEALSARLRALGAEVILRCADLADPQALAALWHDVPPVDVLINNASLFERGTITEMTPDALDTHLRINTVAPLLMAQSFAAQLPQGRSGNVVMLSDSGYGWSLSPHFFSYSVSKLSLTACTDLLAASLAPRIRVNTLALGPTLQGVQDNAESFARIAAISPLKRTSDLAEIWQALHMVLATPSLTGNVLALANGLHLRSHRFA